MEYQKITNLLGGNISDKVSKCITKKWIEVHDLSGDAHDRYKSTKQIRFKALMFIYCCIYDAYIVVKKTIAVTRANNAAYDKRFAFKIMHHLFLAK